MVEASLIVVTHNSGLHIESCLEALCGELGPQDELILVDSASTDATVELAGRYPPARTVVLPANGGFGRAAQAGLAETSGAIAVIVNPDVVVESGAIRRLLQAFAGRPLLAAVQPVLTLADRPERINTWGTDVHCLGFAWCGGYGQVWPARQSEPQPLPAGAFAVSGACIALRRCALVGGGARQAVGGFAADYFLYHEDVDLSWRLLLAGWELGVVPAARARHTFSWAWHDRDNLKGLEANRLATIWRNYHMGTLLLLLPGLLATEACLIAYAVYQGWGGAKLAAYADLWARRRTLGRRSVQATRVVRDRTLLRRIRGELTPPEVAGAWLRILSWPLAAYWWALGNLVWW
jgi:GT2 family glycosyltransferase